MSYMVIPSPTTATRSRTLRGTAHQFGAETPLSLNRNYIFCLRRDDPLAIEAAKRPSSLGIDAPSAIDRGFMFRSRAGVPPLVRSFGQPPGGSTAPPYCGGITPLQQMLYDLGYYTGTVDGLWGPLTEQAVVTFQQAEGLDVGGITGTFCQQLIQRWEEKTGQPLPSGPTPAPEPAVVRGGTLIGRPTAIRREISLPAPPGGGTPAPMPAGTETGFVQTIKDQWNGLSTAGKVVVVGTSAAVLGLVVYALMPGGKPAAPVPSGSFTANPRKRGPAIRVKAKTGRGRETLFGHGIPPKKYRRLGFTKREHYAWPWGYNYPIADAKRTRAAARYFGKHRHRYPRYVQKVVDSRIDRAKKYFAVGEYRGKVKAHKGKHAFSIKQTTRRAVKRKAPGVVTPLRKAA